ncbi:hypothetical protein V8C26DRAFT_277015 [Trichoderma gracile]
MKESERETQKTGIIVQTWRCRCRVAQPVPPARHRHRHRHEHEHLHTYRHDTCTCLMNKPIDSLPIPSPSAGIHVSIHPLMVSPPCWHPSPCLTLSCNAHASPNERSRQHRAYVYCTVCMYGIGGGIRNGGGKQMWPNVQSTRDSLIVFFFRKVMLLAVRFPAQLHMLHRPSLGHRWSVRVRCPFTYDRMFVFLWRDAFCHGLVCGVCALKQMFA